MKPIILYAGRYHGNHSTIRHFHAGVELVFVVSGACSNQTPQGNLCGKEGAFFVLPPGLIHRQLDHGAVETFFVVFELEGDEFSTLYRVIEQKNDSFSGGWMMQLFQLYSERKWKECNLLLELLLQHLNDAEQQTKSGEEKPLLLQHAIEFSKLHFSDGLSPGELAAGIGCSGNYLNALFRRYEGKSTGGHLTDLRLAHARRLLLHSHLSVKEIGLECGYRTNHYFCRVFRARHGCTPLEYRIGQGRTGGLFDAQLTT